AAPDRAGPAARPAHHPAACRTPRTAGRLGSGRTPRRRPAAPDRRFPATALTCVHSARLAVAPPALWITYDLGGNTERAPDVLCPALRGCRRPPMRCIDDRLRLGSEATGRRSLSTPYCPPGR